MTEATLDPDALAAAIDAGASARAAPHAPGEGNMQRARAVTIVEISAYLDRVDDDTGVRSSGGRLAIASVLASLAALLFSLFSLGFVIGQATSFQQNGRAPLSMIGLRQ